MYNQMAQRVQHPFQASEDRWNGGDGLLQHEESEAWSPGLNPSPESQSDFGVSFNLQESQFLYR